ncbi:MAG: BLUF domain-containing protein [Ramlibacter sp.]|nr:BLUF domain-containing protein [Ramlibacter sp.]
MSRPLPPYAAGAGDQEVERIICASMTTGSDGLFAQMEAIRASALRHNPPLGLHAVLLCQAGWFVHWAEGPHGSTGALMARVREDPRHHSQRVVHQSRGKRFLQTPWSMMLSPSGEPAADFGRRVTELRYMMDRGRQFAPTSVIRRLSAPLQLPLPDGESDPEAFHRVGVCSASPNGAFDLVRWLAHRHDEAVASRRFAGEADMDSGSDYVEFLEDGQPCRVIAVSRPGLLHGLRRAFLPDWPQLLMLFSGQPRHDAALMSRVAEACENLPCTPTLLGVAASASAHSTLTRQAAKAGLDYVATDPVSPLDCAAVWDRVREHLRSSGPPPSSVWALPTPRLAA